MKNILLTLLCCLFIGSAFSQENSEAVSGFSSVKEATRIADEIVKAAGMKRNFLIAEADVPNAVAVFHQGKRYIMYNPKFVDLLTRATGTRWAAISILAHEIGHHLYPNSVNKGKSALATELEADEFSGFVLEKMGATLSEAQAAISVLASGRASESHPARLERINSIAKGWRNAGGVEEEGNAEEATVSASRAFPSGLIAGTIHFNASSEDEYYITSRMNVIKVTDDRIRIIARFGRSTNSDFPYMIYDDTGYRVYVNDEGRIYSSKGKVLGLIVFEKETG